MPLIIVISIIIAASQVPVSTENNPVIVESVVD